MNIAFLFDLDGVIIDSEREYTRIWNSINDTFPTGEENFAVKIKGTTLEKILDSYYPDPEVRANVEELLYLKEKQMKYSYCPGAREFLQYLIDNDIKYAIVTSSNGLKMEHLYHDIPEFKELCPNVIDGSMVEHSKPDPEGYLKGAAMLGMDIRDCVVCEDSFQGATAGRRSGAYVVGVEGTIEPDRLSQMADIVVKDLRDLDLKKVEETIAIRNTEA